MRKVRSSDFSLAPTYTSSSKIPIATAMTDNHDNNDLATYATASDSSQEKAKLEPVDTIAESDPHSLVAEGLQLEEDAGSPQAETLDPYFAENVSSFLQKLEPISRFFPDHLLAELRDLQATAQDASGKQKPLEQSQWSREIKRGSMQDWLKSPFQAMSDDGVSVPIVQAFYHQKPERYISACTGGATINPEAKNNNVIDTNVIGDHKNLQMIVTRSEILCSELESIGSFTFPYRPAMIPPPYKSLLRFLPAMSLRLTEISTKLRDLQDSGPRNDQPDIEGSTKASVKEAKAQDTRPSETEDKNYRPDKERDNQPPSLSNPEYETLSLRVSHLQCLYDFICEELRGLINLRAQVAKGTLESITFEDLWHLIEPGDLVVATAYGHDQVYKVYSVTGGQIRRRTRTRKEIEESDPYLYPPPPVVNFEPFDDIQISDLHGEDEDDEAKKNWREEAAGVGTWTSLKVDCYSMAFDGTYIGPIEVCKKIKYYMGERRIRDLPLYPVRFHPEKDKLLSQMQDRGTKFLSSSGYKKYEGKVGAWRRQESRDEIHGDVYVDHDEYYQQWSGKRPSLGKLFRSRQDPTEVEYQKSSQDHQWNLSGHEVDHKLAEEFIASHRTSLERKKAVEFMKSPYDLSLMPHQVIGYVFGLRRWCLLDVDLIEDIDNEASNAEKSAFEDLVIPEGYRKLLVALIENHASGLQRREHKLNTRVSSVTTQVDLIRGKGRGLIILLHGPPGSGKTSTTESIAAYTNRPLYSITCGDVGLTPEVVESRLLKHFARADKWGCVLLLDEADVFLMQRNWESTTRNALVSVFLRQLEYFPGILFLTTNRPGVLDEAFKSRIHIALKYPKIDLESTKKMWTNIMNRFERDNRAADIKIQFDRDSLLEFAESHFQRCEREGVAWNGRQIRNAFQTALALGHYDRTTKLRENHITEAQALSSGKKKWTTVKITKANFKNIAKTARDFEEYIDLLRGKDSDLARQAELRDDEYNAGEPRARKEYSITSRGKDPMSQGRSSASSLKANAPKSKKTAYMESEEEDDDDDDDEDDDDEDASQDKDD